MVKRCLWTTSGARLQPVQTLGTKDFHWLFLPGGPGLGSESLSPLLDILELPGTVWRLDLPGDGSNTTSNDSAAFSHWSSALIEAVRKFKHVVLVAHSTGGMYALSTPEIEKLLVGIILLDSAPDSGWQTSFEETLRSYPIPSLELLQEMYRKYPSNEALKALTVASAPYLFTKKGLEAGIEMLNTLPYNCETCQWSEEHFDQTYKAKWVPQKIPTLILSGEHDLITPLKLFSDDKRFCRDNIELKSVKNAGHFPWIDNPTDVTAAFSEYCSQLDLPLTG